MSPFASPAQKKRLEEKMTPTTDTTGPAIAAVIPTQSYYAWCAVCHWSGPFRQGDALARADAEAHDRDQHLIGVPHGDS